MMLWVRTYPMYHMLSAMFGVSKSTVESVITELFPVLFANLKTYIKWLSLREWQNLRGNWEKLADAVGAIDGTSHEIYLQINEPQQQFYSGNRSYHCLHTQLVVDATGII